MPPKRTGKKKGASGGGGGGGGGGSGFLSNVLSAAATTFGLDESSTPTTPVEESQPSPPPMAWRDPFNKNSRADQHPPSPAKTSNREAGATMTNQASHSSFPPHSPNSPNTTRSRIISSPTDNTHTPPQTSTSPTSPPATSAEPSGTGRPLTGEQKSNLNSNNSDSVSAREVPLPPDTASEIIHQRNSVTDPPDSPSEEVPLGKLKSKTSYEPDPPLPTDITSEIEQPPADPKPEPAAETSTTASTAETSVSPDVKSRVGIPTPFTQAGQGSTSPKSPSKESKSPQVQTTTTAVSPPPPPPKETVEEDKDKEKIVEPEPSHSIDSTPRPPHISLQNPPVGRNSFAAASSNSNSKSKDNSDAPSAKNTKQKDPVKPVEKKDPPKPVGKKDPPKPVEKDPPKPINKPKDTPDTSSVITPKSANRPLPSTPKDTNPRPQQHGRKSSGTFTETDADPSTYGTPLSTATNTRSSTPSTVRGLMMHDTVKRTTTIDWYIKLPLNPEGIPVDYETHTLLSSTASGDGSGTVTWRTDAKENPEEPTSIISFDCPARLDLRIYSTTTSQSPIIDRYVDGYRDDAPKMIIPWSDLKGLTGGKSVLELLVSISMTDAKEPLPSDPIITETCSPASIEALGGFLDQPGGHDVVFQFPGRSTFLYADRYMLQRASVYFRSRLQLPGERGERSSTPTNTSSSSRKKLDDDSDDEFEGEDEESRASVDTGAPNGIANGTSIPQTPGPRRQKTSVAPINTSGFNGSATPPPPTHSKIDFHGVIPPHFRLEQVPQYPPYNVGVSVTQTSEISYRTFRAVLYYMYTGYIAFAPITSNIPLTDDTKLSAKEQHEKRRVARESMVRTYVVKYPNRPEPVSPKSVYVAARKYGLPALEAQALARIQVDMAPAVTVVELFSPFTRAHPNIRDYQLEKVVNVWPLVQKTHEWNNTRKEAKEKPDSYFTEALFDIIDRLPKSP